MVLIAALVVTACPVAAGVIDGSQVNLASIRGNTATTSNLTDGDPILPLWPLGVPPRDVRFRAGGDDLAMPWWQLDFGAGVSYNVQDFEFLTHTIYSSLTWRIDTSLDGTTWTTATKGMPGADGDGFLVSSSGYIKGSLAAPVNARFVRLVVPEYTNADHDYGVILSWMRLAGPNTFDVTPAISIAQPLWSTAGTPTITDVNNRTPVEKPLLTDDFVRGEAQFGHTWGTGMSLGYIGEDDNRVFVPIQMTVPLGDLYAVSAVGISTMSDDRRATEVDIWISPDAEGDNWTLVMTAPLPANEMRHYEFEFDRTYDAQRVRFDLTKADNDRGECYVAQLYVYGSNVPEPATMTLLAFGSLSLLRRRWR